VSGQLYNSRNCVGPTVGLDPVGKRSFVLMLGLADHSACSRHMECICVVQIVYKAERRIGLRAVEDPTL
jgi:hypothetical protein